MSETRVEKLVQVILGDNPSVEGPEQEKYDLQKKIVEAAIKSIGMRIKLNKCPPNKKTAKQWYDFYTNDKKDIVVQLIKKTLSKETEQGRKYKVGDGLEYQITMIGDHAISSVAVKEGSTISQEGLNEDIINEYIATMCKYANRYKMDMIIDVAGCGFHYTGEPSPNRYLFVGPYVREIKLREVPAAASVGEQAEAQVVADAAVSEPTRPEADVAAVAPAAAAAGKGQGQAASGAAAGGGEAAGAEQPDSDAAEADVAAASGADVGVADAAAAAGAGQGAEAAAAKAKAEAEAKAKAEAEAKAKAEAEAKAAAAAGKGQGQAAGGGGALVPAAASGAGGGQGGSARQNYRRSRSKKESNKKRRVSKKKRRVSKKRFRR